MCFAFIRGKIFTTKPWSIFIYGCHHVALDGSSSHQHLHALVWFTKETHIAAEDRMEQNWQKFLLKRILCPDYAVGVFKYITRWDGQRTTKNKWWRITRGTTYAQKKDGTLLMVAQVETGIPTKLVGIVIPKNLVGTVYFDISREDFSFDVWIDIPRKFPLKCSNMVNFWARKMLFFFKWVRISPEIDWYHYQGASPAPTCVVRHQTMTKKFQEC